MLENKIKRSFSKNQFTKQLFESWLSIHTERFAFVKSYDNTYGHYIEYEAVYAGENYRIKIRTKRLVDTVNSFYIIRSVVKHTA